MNTGKTRFKKGVAPWNKGLKGVMKAWNKGIPSQFKGIPRNEDVKHKISLAKKGKKRFDMIGNTFGFSSGYMKKENHWNWKGGITTKDKLERIKFRKYIQKKVFERDNYTCQICDEQGGKLQVDHIQSWAEYVELRFNIENCRTLCQECHYEITFKKPMPQTIKTWGHNLKYYKFTNFKERGELI